MKAWRVARSQRRRVMTDEVLQEAVAGIPRIAEAIAAIPAENRARAFDGAERRYLQTAPDIGGGEVTARDWVSAVMLHLRAQVVELDFATQKLLKALHEELAPPGPEADNSSVS